MAAGSQCRFTFQGLQSAVQGYEVRDLSARAQFSVDSEKASTIQKTASSLEVDAASSDHAHATVNYPSMLEIWAEMYYLTSIRVIEVRASVGRSLVQVLVCTFSILLAFCLPKAKHR